MHRGLIPRYVVHERQAAYTYTITQFGAPDASTLELGLGLDTDVPRSAPLFSDPHRPPVEDPFAGSPSTTTLSTFPSYSTTTTQFSDTSSRKSQSQRSSRHIPLFGRTASGRDYPKGNSVDDKEESERLFRQRDPEVSPDASEPEELEPDLPPTGSVRLVTSRPDSR